MRYSSSSPVVVLSTELEVAEHHGDISAGNDQDDENQQQEAEHVVVIPHPDGLQDEKHLDENRSVGQDPSNRDSKAAPKEPRLVRNLYRRTRNIGYLGNERVQGSIWLGQEKRPREVTCMSGRGRSNKRPGEKVSRTGYKHDS